MKVKLFPFQEKAVEELRKRAVKAKYDYECTQDAQVISLQAPTGAGKTLIMASLIEEIYRGSARYDEEPDAIFVWLSDSPELNEQSLQKIALKTDSIVGINKCVTIKDESFDKEELEDGYIYFLNTQKLGKSSNLGKHSDSRQYTIWETLKRTAQKKSDRLYFIIDEAHRGALGNEASRATTIMQRFIKGDDSLGLPPMPLVIGVSATSARFNKLAENVSVLQTVVVSTDEVRSSGLLKDKIYITYPDDDQKNDAMSVLGATALEWKNKCEHWRNYSIKHHERQVNPILIVQVQAGKNSSISETDLDEVVRKIEEAAGQKFSEHEVVHTFGNKAPLTCNGLKVEYIEPTHITDAEKVKLVLFKESLSTGWDCPRAETMMSFRRACDATYIAQLLGRMVRTPLQHRIRNDESLNNVRLFLPHFDKETVEDVIKELRSSECGEIPTVIEPEKNGDNVTLTPNFPINHPKVTKKKDIDAGISNQDKEQPSLDFDLVYKAEGTGEDRSGGDTNKLDPHVDISSLTEPLVDNEKPAKNDMEYSPTVFNRRKIIDFINRQTLLTYTVRKKRISDYQTSLFDLAGLLTRSGICPEANQLVKTEMVKQIRQYVQNLHENGKYEQLAKEVSCFNLSSQIFDMFGKKLEEPSQQLAFATISESDLDRQLRKADELLGGCGISNEYGREYAEEQSPNAYKIDCILFAESEDCRKKLKQHAEEQFHKFCDNFRRDIVCLDEKYQEDYRRITADGDPVSKSNLKLPEAIDMKSNSDGKKNEYHLYADEKGQVCIELDSWEQGVLNEEQARSDFICWLRNIPRASWGLCIPYEFGGETKAMYPDFLVVRTDNRADYVIDILEPHSSVFKDNLAKAKGLAKYAEKELKIGRVQLIRESRNIKGKCFKRLELSKGVTREKVFKCITNEELDHLFDTDGIEQ